MTSTKPQYTNNTDVESHSGFAELYLNLLPFPTYNIMELRCHGTSEGFRFPLCDILFRGSMGSTDSMSVSISLHAFALSPPFSAALRLKPCVSTGGLPLLQSLSDTENSHAAFFIKSLKVLNIKATILQSKKTTVVSCCWPVSMRLRWCHLMEWNFYKGWLQSSFFFCSIISFVVAIFSLFD